MKKTISLLLSLLMLSLGTAFAEDTSSEVVEPVIGRITEMREDGILLETLDGTQVQVNTTEETTLVVDWALGAGDVISVIYDGTMNETMPPQVTAQSIRCFSLEGLVSEVDTENNRVLINSPESGQVFANLPDDVKATDFAGVNVRVYFNGIMAMSLPGQLYAYAIEHVEVETGKVTEIGTDFFMLEGENGQFRVNFDAHSKVADSFNVGDDVHVYYNGITTRSMPPQIYALVISAVIVVG